MNYSKKTSWVALVAMCLTACAGGEDEPMTSPPDGATTMDSGDVDATTPPIDAAPPEPDAAPPPPPDSPPRWDEMARAWFEDTPAEGLTLRWSGATDDNGITGYRVERDGLMIAEVGGEETMAAFETAPDHEEHVFRVVAGDAAGQWTPGPSATYRLDDSTPPTWTEGAALVATDLSARGVTLAWTAAEDDVGVIHYLLADDDAEPSVVENTRYRADDADPRQERSFTVWAVDAAGNQSQPLSLTLTIPGGTAPTWPEGSTVQALAPGADWIDLQWTAAQDDEAVTQYTLYNGLVPVTTVAGDQLRGRISGLSPYATYQLSVSAEDADGNRTAGPETSARTADAVTPSWPEDARIVASDITPSSLTLGWTPADDDVDVAGYVISRAGSPDLPAEGQSVRVEGLSPWTDYQFTVNAVDPAGNTSADGPSLALRTPDGVAPTWPRNPLRAAALGTDAVRLDWDPAADDVAVTGYRVSRAGAEDVVLDGATHTLQVQGLPPWTTYTFSIEAMDAAGNVSATTPVARARTLDQGVPTWADGEALQITDLTPNELVLRWPAPQDDVAVTVVMVYRDGALLAALPGGATSHAVEGLDPWTHIDFEIRAGDAAGNWTRAPLTARTQTPDWVRPDWGPNPTLMFQNVTPDSVLLRWPAAVDDVGLVYHVHQDGALLDTLPEGTTELAVVNLTPWGTYAFTVEAVDAAGNLAQPSLSGRIRTADDAPPTWPADAALTAGNATPRSLTLTWSDAADDVGLTYVIHRDGVLFGTFPEGTTSVDVDRLTPATDYSFSIYVVDPAGNRAATLRLNTQTPDNISPWWPADPALSVTDLTSTSLTLQWPQAQDDVSLTYLVRHDGVEVATLPPETLSMAFQGLSTWGEYPFDVVAIDTFGNRSPVLALTVRTPDQVVPSWAPDAQLDVSDLTEQSLTLDWPAAVDDIRVSYLVYRDGNLLAALPPEMTTLAVADLTPWTDYQFRVAAVDPAGNISAPALTAAVQTPDAASPDWGPQATLTAENVAPDSLTLRWSPATDNVGLVYRVRQDDAIIDTVPEGTVELAVADLSPWQNYAFAVEAVDPAGNIGPNGPSLALQTPDERAPQWGPDSDLTAPALDHQSVTLQWPPAVDDAAVTGYRLSINGAALPALPGDQNSVDINQLTEATDYAFEIIAFDAAGNESANPLTLALQTPRTPCPEPLAVQASNTSAAPFGFVRFTITGGTGAYQMDFLAPRSGGNLLANPFSYLAGPTGDVVDTIRFSDAGCMDVVDVDIQVYDQAQLNPQRVTLPLGGCVALDVTGGSGEFDFSVVSNQPVGQIDAQGVYTSDDEVGRDILRVVDRRTGESLESIVTISQDARFDLGGQNLFLPLGGHLDPSFAVGTGQFTLASEDDVITISEDGRRLIANRVGTTRVTATDPTVGCLGPNADQPAQVTVNAHVVSAIAPSAERYVSQNHLSRGVLLTGRDFNGDGFDDIVAGARDLHFALHDSGVVALFLGGPDGLAEQPAQVLGGKESGGQFGSALGTGDFNGDERLDLVVGAQAEKRVGVGYGATYVFYGQPDGTFSDTPDRSLSANGDSIATFGNAVAVCDFDGDGTDDVAIGSAHARFYLNGALPYCGSVSIYYGDGQGLEGAPRQVLWSRLPTDLGWSPTRNSYFGQTLAAGDFDGDGLCELAVSGYGDDGRSQSDRAQFATNDAVPPDYLGGTVFLFEGRPGLGVAETPFRHISIESGQVNEQRRTRATFGMYMALRDLDDDGQAELVLPHHVFRGGPIPAEPELDLTLASTADWRDPHLGTTQGSTHGPMTLADLDGDDRLDLVRSFDGLQVYLGQEDGFFADAFDPAFSFRLGIPGMRGPPEQSALPNRAGLFSPLADTRSFGMTLGAMNDPQNPGEKLLITSSTNRFAPDPPAFFTIRHAAQGLDVTARHLPTKRAGGMTGDAVLLMDVTGDGTDDWIIGSPGIFANALGYRAHELVVPKEAPQGGVFIYAMDDGRLPAEPTTILDPRRDGGFGEALASAGDFDGDGIDDLAVTQVKSSPAHGAYVGCNGAAPIYVAGKWDCPEGVNHSYQGNRVQLVTMPAECDINLRPNSVSLYRGADVDAWRAGGETGGRRPAFILHPPFDAEYLGDTPLIGQGLWHPADSFVDSVPLTGDFDFNGDGLADLAVGAPGHDSVQYVGSYGARGGAFVYFGRAPQDPRLTEVICTPDVTLTSSDRSSLLGWAMTGIGDLDNDGCDELAISAPGGPAGFQNKPDWVGYVHILLGYGPNCARQSGEYLTLEGQVGPSGMGWAILGGRDLDGDQIDDLVLGAPHAVIGGNVSGLFFAILGAELAALQAADMFRPLVNGSLDPDELIPWPVDLSTSEAHFGPRGQVNIRSGVSGRPNTNGSWSIERFGSALTWVPGIGDHGVGVAVGSHRQDIGTADNAGEIIIYEWVDDPDNGKHFQVKGRMVGDTKVPNGAFGSNLTGGTVNGLPTVGVGAPWASPQDVEDQVQNGAGYLLKMR